MSRAPKMVLESEQGDKAENDAKELLFYHEQVAALAYRFWQERGCPDGSPEADWSQAEEKLHFAAGRPISHPQRQ